MIQALIEKGYEISMVSGTSAGAIIGALYCRGFSPKSILNILESINYLNVFRPAFNWKALLNLEIAENALKDYFPEDDFSSLEIPFVLATTDFNNGKIKYFKRGQLIKPLIASCSIPVIFTPVNINGHFYADGGILDNLPIEPLKKKCNFIIGLHSNPIGKRYANASNWKGQLERAPLLTFSSRDRMKMKKCNIFLEPEKLVNYHIFDFKKLREIYDIGYEFAQKELELLPFK